MNSYDRGRYADLMLNRLRSGKEFNDNQADMLIALGTNKNSSDEEIETILRVQVSNNPPINCVIPDYVE